MKDKSERKKLLFLIFEFFDLETPADRFAARFMKLWKKARDAQWSTKATWNEPLDEQLQAAFLGKKISPEEFRKRWNELWGFTENDVKFHDMIDKVFSACDDYRHYRGSGSKYEDDKLRASTAEAFLLYINEITSKEGVRSR